MTSEAIASWLMSDQGYPRERAAALAGKILNCASFIQAGFEQWWQTKQLPELEVEGVTLKLLIEEHNMKPVAAFLTLDWLLRDPEEAKKFLHTGYDAVVFPPQEN